MSFAAFHYKGTKKLLGIGWNADFGVGLVSVLVVGEGFDRFIALQVMLKE